MSTAAGYLTTAVFFPLKILKSHSANDRDAVRGRVRGRDTEEETEEEKGLTERGALLEDEC